MKKLQKRLWLIGCGATKGDLYPMITLLQQECVNTEITVLIYKTNIQRHKILMRFGR